MTIDTDDFDSTAEGNYIAASQQIVLSVLLALWKSPLYPVTSTNLAVTLDMSRSKVFRALKNLQLADLAELNEDSNMWRVSVTSTQLSERLRVQLGDLHNTYLGTIPQQQQKDD